MMITSSRPDNRRRNVLVFLLALVVLVAFGSFFNRHLSGVGIRASQPFWQARNGVAGVWSVLGTGFTSKQELEAHNAALQQALLVAQAGAVERDRLLAEVATLREALGRRPEISTRQTARVLVGWHEGPFDIVIVDLGRENALVPITTGAAVLGPGNTWLGVVSEVQDRTSKIKLLTLAGEQTPVVIGEERLEAVLEGRGGGNFVATLPRGVTILPGSEALASRQGEDSLVAIVGAVESDETGDQRVYLRAPLRASTLPYVEIES